MDRPSRRQLLRLGGAALGGWLAGGAANAAAAPVWADYRASGPFQCRADFPLDSYENLFLELANLQRELTRTLGVPPAKEPIEVYFFRDQSTHQAFMQEWYPRIPYRRALFVKSGSRGRVFAYQHEDLDIDVRHESTHALLHASLPMVPLWLDEGLAEYFELAQPQRAFDHPHLSTLRWNLRLGIMPSLQSLEERDDLADMGGLEYRFAWAWAHFLLHGPVPGHRALVLFLRDIALRRPPGRLSARLATELPEVERQLVQHFKHWRRK
jgi:hypothetical protein